MTKRLFWIAVLVFTIGSAAQGQWMQPIELYLGAGQSSPNQPERFERFFNGSYNLSFGAGIHSFPFMETVGRFECHRFPSETDEYEGGLITLKTLGVDGKFNIAIPGSPLEPYLLVGMGMSWLRQSEWEPHSEELFLSGQTDFYFDLGLGAQFQFDGPLGLFGQWKLVRVVASRPNKEFADNLRFHSFTIGIKILEKL